MLGVKFIKIQPTTYLLQYRAGQIVREGAGLAFFYYAPTAASMVFGKITPNQPLTLVSQMAEHGVIFSDGIEQDFVEFNSGARAVISLAPRQGTLVV